MRTDYGAILSTVIKDTSDAIREVNDTSALIAPNAWGANIRTMHSDADYETALSYIPIKTVSGAIASFNDGAGGLDLKSLKVAITAQQSGSGTPAPDNNRPIIGVSECNVVRCGKNLFDKSKERLAFVTTMQTALSNFKQYGKYATGYCNSASGTMSNNGTYTTFFIPCKPNTTYSLKCYTSSAFTSVHTLDGNGNTLSKSSNWAITYTVTTENNAKYLAFAYAGTEGATVEEASTPSAEYIEYTGNTYTIQLGDTYYGCHINVTNGVLTVDSVKTLLKDLPNRWIKMQSGTGAFYIVRSLLPYAIDYANRDNTKSNVYSYSKSGTQSNYSMRISDALYIVDDRWADVTEWQDYIDNNDIYIVYPLATPITVQLTATQIEQLLGANNVWADTGDINECIYYSTASGVQNVEGSYQRADGTGVSSVPYLIYTYTATEDCTMCFCGTIATDTSQSQGFLKMVVNDDVEYRTAGLTQYNEIPFSFDNISLQSGDTVKFYGDWEGSHSGCFFHLRLSMVKAV